MLGGGAPGSSDPCAVGSATPESEIEIELLGEVDLSPHLELEVPAAPALRFTSGE